MQEFITTTAVKKRSMQVGKKARQMFIINMMLIIIQYYDIKLMCIKYLNILFLI